MDLKWIKRGWSDMWWNNGPYIVVIGIVLFFICAVVNPMACFNIILGIFCLIAITSLYYIFVNPFVKAFKNRNM